jgi:hypothetical protein
MSLGGLPTAPVAKDGLIAGSNHNDFTDLGPVAQHLELSPALRASLLLGTIDARRAVALQRSYLTVFFNLQLCERR